MKGNHMEKQLKLLAHIILPTLLTVLKNNKKTKKYKNKKIILDFFVVLCYNF